MKKDLPKRQIFFYCSTYFPGNSDAGSTHFPNLLEKFISGTFNIKLNKLL